MPEEPTDRIIMESGKPFLRNSHISAWEVYKKSAFGKADEEILQEYPGLVAEDLLAVREYFACEIKSRTHDDWSGRPILPKDQLKHGLYYKGRCRNATIARWNAEENVFYHWRKKFDRIYIQTIKYPTDEDEPWWDIFFVVEDLPNPKFEIPFDAEAAFTGNLDDLTEHNAEMWRQVKIEKQVEE